MVTTTAIMHFLQLFLLQSLLFTAALAWENGVGETREIDTVGLEETPEDCGDFEVYWDCGTECPETCYTMGKPRICGLRCKSGCFCREGLVRRSDGKCVRPFECNEV